MKTYVINRKPLGGSVSIVELTGITTVGGFLTHLNGDVYRGGWAASFRFLNTEDEQIYEGVYGELEPDLTPYKDQKIHTIVEATRFQGREEDLYLITLKE